MPGDFNMTVQNDPLRVEVINPPGSATPAPKPNDIVFEGSVVIPANTPLYSQVKLEVPVPQVVMPGLRYMAALFLETQDTSQSLGNCYFLNQEQIGGETRPVGISAETTPTSNGNIHVSAGSTGSTATGVTVTNWLVGSGPGLIMGTASRPGGSWVAATLHAKVRRV